MKIYDLEFNTRRRKYRVSDNRANHDRSLQMTRSQSCGQDGTCSLHAAPWARQLETIPMSEWLTLTLDVQRRRMESRPPITSQRRPLRPIHRRTPFSGGTLLSERPSKTNAFTKGIQISNCYPPPVEVGRRLHLISNGAHDKEYCSGAKSRTWRFSRRRQLLLLF